VRVWVARAEPGASATAERLRALGHEPVVAPLLEARPLPDAALDLTGVAALAFTSRHGVSAFAALSPVRALPVFAVGDATADIARTAGFGDVVSADGDVTALAGLIARAELSGAVLHPRAAEPAGDLAGALRAAGVEARDVAVYETCAVESLPPGAAEPAPDAVLVHSPKAARALARLAPADAVRGMAAFALSAACAEPLRSLPWRSLAVAEAPREAALLALLPAASAPDDPPPKPMMGWAFWLALAFGLACVAAGAAVAVWGPRLSPP